MKKLTQKRLKEVLHYDPDTGIFTNRINRSSRAREGKEAGCICPDGYRYIYIDNKKYHASRLAFLYMRGYFPEHEVDHEDRIKHNDKWENLRHLTHSCNMKNVGIKSNNTSGVTGVYWGRGRQRWRAKICVAGEIKYLGDYIDFIDAVKIRYQAEVKYGWFECNDKTSAYLYLKDNEFS